MPVTQPGLPEDAARLAARRAHVARQLDLMLDVRGPVDQVRRLIADLDRISQELSQALRDGQAPTARDGAARDLR